MSRRTNRTAINAHDLRWMPLEVKNSQGWAWIKTLSLDKETGARTALVKFEPGFRQEKAVSTWPSDMFVLEGEMQCGDLHYGPGTFHYRPKGTAFGPISTRTGITRIVYTSNALDSYDPTPIFIQNINDIPWEPSYTDHSGKTARVKVLHRDLTTQHSVYIQNMRFAGVPGAHISKRVSMLNIHDYSEEAFVLDGEMDDYVDDVDGHFEWQPWSYSCRPPNESVHGMAVVRKAPVQVLMRLGWVGNMTDKESPATSGTSGTTGKTKIIEPETVQLTFAE